MKISYNWLKNFIHLSENPEEIATKLTQSGVEVGCITPLNGIQGELKGLVIGEIIACEPHPHADYLKKVFVTIGTTNPLSIICGDPIVQKSQKVVVACQGTTIYNYQGEAYTITQKKIYGILSEGMLCSEYEIGISHSHTSIIILDTALPPGTPAEQYFKVPIDYLLDIEITPNRVDACSHLGIARELQAILNRPLQYNITKEFTLPQVALLPIHIDTIDHDACPRYSAIVLSNIVIKSSPQWLQNRLKKIGIQPINNVVDVTNFITHDIGQPLHAFDYDKIKDKTISVKKLQNKSTFITINQISIVLEGEELMICDAKEPLCVAGIIGGNATKITDETKNVLLESAYFKPDVIRKTVQQHGITTDASFRYERGADPNMTINALQQACLLLQEIAQATIVSELIDRYSQQIKHFQVTLLYKNVQRLVGYAIPPTQIKEILHNLEIIIEEEDEKGLTASIPPYRVDVQREIDLIEEIIRIYGYNALPTKSYLGSTYLASTTSSDKNHQIFHDLSLLLTAHGYHEIYTNSLITNTYREKIPTRHNDVEHILVLNPLSNMVDMLRHTLLFSGLEVIAHNIARKETNIKLFELGTTYVKKNKKYQETDELALWITGQIPLPNGIEKLDVTFQTLNSVLYKILERLGIKNFKCAFIQDAPYHEGVRYIYNHTLLFIAGQITPSLCASMGIHQPVFFATAPCTSLMQAVSSQPIYEFFSKFPAVKRDLSLVLDKAITFQQVKELIMDKAFKLIQSITLFDVYQGAPLAADKKAYALSIILQDKNKTLDEQTIDQTITQVIYLCEKELNALIRR